MAGMNWVEVDLIGGPSAGPLKVPIVPPYICSDIGAPDEDTAWHHYVLVPGTGTYQHKGLCLDAIHLNGAPHRHLEHE